MSLLSLLVAACVILAFVGLFDWLGRGEQAALGFYESRIEHEQQERNFWYYFIKIVVWCWYLFVLLKVTKNW